MHSDKFRKLFPAPSRIATKGEIFKFKLAIYSEILAMLAMSKASHDGFGDEMMAILLFLADQAGRLFSGCPSAGQVTFQ